MNKFFAIKAYLIKLDKASLQLALTKLFLSGIMVFTRSCIYQYVRAWISSKIEFLEVALIKKLYFVCGFTTKNTKERITRYD